MIKEKEVKLDTYTFNGDRMSLQTCVALIPPQEANAVTLKSYMDGVINERNLPIGIDEDTYSYKIGFLKSEKVPCLVVYYRDGKNKFRKIIIAFKNREDNIAIRTGWYGQSQNDKLIEKYKKGQKKEERKKARAQKDYAGVSDYGKHLFQAMANNHTLKKIQSRVEEENSVHNMLLSFVSDVINQVQAGW